MNQDHRHRSLRGTGNRIEPVPRTDPILPAPTRPRFAWIKPTAIVVGVVLAYALIGHFLFPRLGWEQYRLTTILGSVVGEQERAAMVAATPAHEARTAVVTKAEVKERVEGNIRQEAELAPIQIQREQTMRENEVTAQVRGVAEGARIEIDKQVALIRETTPAACQMEATTEARKRYQGCISNAFGSGGTCEAQLQMDLALVQKLCNPFTASPNQP